MKEKLKKKTTVNFCRLNVEFYNKVVVIDYDNLSAFVAHERVVVALKIHLREINFKKSKVSFCKIVYLPTYNQLQDIWD